MRCIFIISLILLSITGTAQSEKVYQGGILYVVKIDSTGKEIDRLPLAENVVVTFKPFYKSYHILATSDRGYFTYYLTYLSKADNSILMLDEESKDQRKYLVNDNLQISGTLTMLSTKSYPNKTRALYVIEGCKLQ